MQTAIGSNPYCQYCTNNDCHHCNVQVEYEVVSRCMDTFRPETTLKRTVEKAVPIQVLPRKSPIYKLLRKPKVRRLYQ